MRSLLLGIVAVLIAVPVSAQQWTSEQTEVIDQLKECWDIWVEDLADTGPNAWHDRCATDDVSYWNRGSIGGVLADTRSWDVVQQYEYKWVDIRPLSIKVYDDMAVVQFYGYWSETQGEGRVITEAKRTEVFVRVNNRWLLTVGHSELTPQPQG
jgi:hypothetical protein